MKRLWHTKTLYHILQFHPATIIKLASSKTNKFGHTRWIFLSDSAILKTLENLKPSFPQRRLFMNLLIFSTHKPIYECRMFYILLYVFCLLYATSDNYSMQFLQALDGLNWSWQMLDRRAKRKQILSYFNTVVCGGIIHNMSERHGLVTLGLNTDHIGVFWYFGALCASFVKINKRSIIPQPIQLIE